MALHGAAGAAQVRLKYRRVNQALSWETADMHAARGGWHAEIPASYTDSPFSLQYYFELLPHATVAVMYPGVGLDLTDRPYFLGEQA